MSKLFSLSIGLVTESGLQQSAAADPLLVFWGEEMENNADREFVCFCFKYSLIYENVRSAAFLFKPVHSLWK